MSFSEVQIGYFPIPDMIYPKLGRFTPEHEVSLIGSIVSHSKGNVLELGCNEGHTTRDLATNFPERHFYAVDCTAENLKVDPYQNIERVTSARFAIYARDLPNVSVIDCDTKELNYSDLKDVGVIFIDADHTYDGVKQDTQNAMNHLQQNSGGIVIWHDFFKDQPNHWVKVSQYIYAEIVKDYDVKLFLGTTVAFMELQKAN